MLKKYPCNCSMYGFTLVELLVVISIISLLMSIMMPALNKARDQANRMDCMNNIRQLTFAWMVYAENNDGKLCSPHTGWIDEDYGLPCPCRYGKSHWVLGGPIDPPSYEFNHIGDSETAITQGVLWPYVKNLEVYHCKMHSKEFLRSYALSNTMGGFPISVNLRRNWQFRNIAHISRPSERLVFTEARSSTRRGGGGLFRWLAGSFFPLLYKNNGDISIWWEWGGSPFITTRHNNGTNISFADGHCDWWRYEDPETIRSAKKEQLRKDPSCHINVDAEYMAELLKGQKGKY